MDEVALRGALDRERREVDRALARLLAAERGVPARLRRAMKHSVTGGGKRLRPALLLWAYDAWAGAKAPVSRAEALIAACGLELIHTYSLVHDDLPAMDDDVLRRGRPTCHVVFGEATGILAGDGLQALGFTLLARAGGPVAGPLVALVGDAVGPAGMVGGQQEDLEAEGGEVTGPLVQRIHRAKTACLLAAALAGGALLGGADQDTVDEVQRAGIDLGLAFQGADDVLDVTATTAQLGKSAGKDAAAGKATWIRVEGLDKARRRAARDGRRGLKRLEDVLPGGAAGERLLALGRLMWNRDH
ncbi:MAG TPA: polyprenyl synthetase family protein [Candidatus Krumholzibacteria bacterium]|nr:polyprenyl synthetase family protein [Candidatus Krumholzibacteria bacterium]